MTEQLRAQTQNSAATITGVFAVLRAKPGVTGERVMAVMPAEIRATVQLYLEGKIREWYAREDGRGVAKEDMLDHEYIPVGPLMPLRLLIASPSAKP